MQFSATLLVLASTATAAVITPRAETADALVTQLKKLTTLAEQITPKVYAIQAGENAVAKRQANPFQPVIDGANSLSQTATSDIQSMQSTKPYGAADAQKVCAAYNDFTTSNQEMLTTMIGKSALLEGIFQGPVAASLRNLEQSYDVFSFGIIDAVPTCQSTVTSKKDSLDQTLGKTICAYTPGGSLGINLFC